MTVKDFNEKPIPEGVKLLIGPREFKLNKVKHIKGNVYSVFLSSDIVGEESFECRVSAEHEVLVPTPPPSVKSKEESGQGPKPEDKSKGKSK